MKSKRQNRKRQNQRRAKERVLSIENRLVGQISGFLRISRVRETVLMEHVETKNSQDDKLQI